MPEEKTEPVCRTCARWVPYHCIIGRERTEAWKCQHGVRAAPEVLNCPTYLREVGVEAW
jgi:hypothetical protein